MKRYTPKRLKWVKRDCELVAILPGREYRLQRSGRRWRGWLWMQLGLTLYSNELVVDRAPLEQAKQACQRDLEATVADLCDKVCDGE